MSKKICIKLGDDEFYDDAQLLVRSFFGANVILSRKKSGDEDFCFSLDAILPAGIELEGTRGEVHDAFKSRLYDMLCKQTGKTLPWGFLTGVRPAKRAMELIEKYEGASDVRESVCAEFARRFKASEKKAELAFDVAWNEREILKRKIKARETGGDSSFSFYAGIPFCPSTCLYCSFSSVPIGKCKEGLTYEYLSALISEIERSAHIYLETRGAGEAKLKPSSVYVGGGTPTSLSPEGLERLLCCITEVFDVSESAEFCVEAGRPDSITREKLEVLKRFGVDRISVNPQSMNDETLSLIGRDHSTEDVRRAFALARDAGFENINCDIILGLPGEGEKEVEKTAREIEKLAPDSLTVHSLAIKRASRLNIKREEYGEYRLENSERLLEITGDLARRLGMRPYYMYRQQNMAGNFENTGYAIPGKESLYNIVIMEEVQDILATGAGASSKFLMGNGRFERAVNVKDVKGYIQRTEEMIGRKEALLKGVEG